MVCVCATVSHNSEGHEQEVHGHVSSWEHEEEEEVEKEESVRETEHTGIHRRFTFICSPTFTTVNANFIHRSSAVQCKSATQCRRRGSSRDSSRFVWH